HARVRQRREAVRLHESPREAEPLHPERVLGPVVEAPVRVRVDERGLHWSGAIMSPFVPPSATCRTCRPSSRRAGPSQSSRASRTRPPYARRPPATGGTGRGPCPRGAWSGRDAGASVPDDCLHPVFGHQFQLLQLAHSPLLVGRERGGSSERLELLIVGVVLA